MLPVLQRQIDRPPDPVRLVDGQDHLQRGPAVVHAAERLAVLLDRGDQILRDGDVSEGQRKDLDTINRSGEHLLSLINKLLDLAKVESGRTELNIEFAPAG